MARVFTITEGLENLGALKTGGQGSVYKGKRIGEIFTAIKIIPTPVSSENDSDKNFVSFRNEVQKLKKVNEEPNPNVVKILNSGITDSGNFPFIEMEYIEGPDLGELLKPPYDPVFSIKETLKVAEHLSNALAHCHRANVRHGDIKSNNVKFNQNTGNYILLDFGLSVMSDEQRRTSLRHAGAIEFMAPEQTEGHMLFETDVYSFGIILFELIAGTVPFPLKDNGETARNAVVVAHLETPLPEMLELRKQNLPEKWSGERKRSEMQVPQWLINLIKKCLEKKAANRFANGMILQDYLHQHLISSVNVAEQGTALVATDTGLLKENEQLKKQLVDCKNLLQQKDVEIQKIQTLAVNPGIQYPHQNGISKPLFFTLLIITLGLASFAAYTLFKKKETGQQQTNTNTQGYTDSLSNGLTSNDTGRIQLPENREETPQTFPDLNQDDDERTTRPQDQDNRKDTTDDQGINNNNPVLTEKDDAPKTDPNGIGKKYKIKGLAYLYEKPEASGRISAFIPNSSGAVLIALDDKDGYIYVEFATSNGEVKKTWLSKNDLRTIE